jgi:hypothetical protein
MEAAPATSPAPPSSPTATTATAASRPDPEGLLGRRLGPGSRLRVTVEVLEEHPLDPIEHRSYQHKLYPSNMCLHCVEQNPDRFVVLRCGHGRHVSKWRADGQPSQMLCWDAWCPSEHGLQDVIRVPGRSDHAVAIDRMLAAAVEQGVPVITKGDPDA